MPGPSSIRFPKTPPPERCVGAGEGLSARQLRDGDGSVCILAVGKMVEAAEEAADLLEARDVRATVWDVRTIPPDPKMLADARTHSLVVTAEDGIAEGGVGALLAAALGALEAETPAPATIALGTPTAYLPHGKPAALLANLGLDGPGIAATVAKLLDAR